MKIENSVAIVTGGASGLGEATGLFNLYNRHFLIKYISKTIVSSKS